MLDFDYSSLHKALFSSKPPYWQTHTVQILYMLLMRIMMTHIANLNQ